MKLKNPGELPKGQSYVRQKDCYVDFDNGKLRVSCPDAISFDEKQTKALFSSMLIHYMANSDCDIFE